MKEILLALSLSVVPVFLASKNQEPITYTKTIRPILEAKCTPCHSPNSNIGPFDLTTYAGVTSKINLVRDQVLAQNMPPVWTHSDVGKFTDIEQLTDEQAVQLQEWIRHKMPLGPAISDRPRNSSSPTKVPAKPSLSINMGEGTQVHPEGVPYWKILTCDLPKQGGSLSEVNFVPATPRVFRYAQIAIVPRSQQLSTLPSTSLNLPGQQLVGTWAAGYSPIRFSKDRPRVFDPNSKLVVLVHVRPTGKREDASFRIDMTGSKAIANPRTQWITLERPDVLIPAGKSEVVQIDYPIDRELTLRSIVPEARFYAARIELLHLTSEGKSVTVFDNRRWSPYWIGNYTFQKPVQISKGGVLRAKFYYDNDEFCRMNEGVKPKPIHAGPTVSDETCRLHLLVHL